MKGCVISTEDGATFHEAVSIIRFSTVSKYFVIISKEDGAAVRLVYQLG